MLKRPENSFFLKHLQFLVQRDHNFQKNNRKEFPDNMHIYTSRLPKCLQSLTIFHAEVQDELRLQTVHRAKILSSNGPKFPEK